MVGKSVQFDEETWAVINLLRQDRHRSFQSFLNVIFHDDLAGPLLLTKVNIGNVNEDGHGNSEAIP